MDRMQLKIEIPTVYRLILLQPWSFTEYFQLENFRFGANFGAWQQQQQEQHFISPHNIQEIKIYNNSTDDDRGAGCPNW